MAITEKMRQRADNTKKAVNESSIDELMKEAICESIESSLESCNGLSMEEKIQANSENNFITSLLLAKLYIKSQEDQRTTSWKDTVIKCRNQIVLIALFVCTLFALRPELSALVQSFVK